MGPPLATDLPVRLEKLINTVKRCDIAEDNVSLGSVPLCNACCLLLTEEVPTSEAERLLGELESALREQLKRLGYHAARQAMAQAGTPLVDRFLKVVQAGDLDGLAAVLDAQVLQFLRLFLRQP
jgi:hypothetical protein